VKRASSNEQRKSGFIARNGVRQRGAVLPIAIFFFAVLCVGLFAVYNMAQVTSEKRQLVNAADAIAYSTANVAAEGFNYTAYTNRAMISNYQSVGQLTAMWSSVGMSDQYWKNNSKVLKGIAALTKFIPYIGAGLSGVTNAISKFGDFWEKIVNGVRLSSQVLANAGTATISLSNYAIFASQQVHLATTVSSMISMQHDLLAANAPQAEYIPQTVVYQIGKSMVDFGSMIKLHQPPRKFLGLQKMQEAGEKDNKDKIEFNLVHHMMMKEMFNFTSGSGGRRLFPNAVGLWAVDGCNLSAINGLLTGLETNGLEQIVPALKGNVAADVIGPVIEAFMNTVGVIVSPIMCLYERTGGTRMMQMQDGSYGWSNIDVIDINPHLFNIHIPLANIHIPLAGAVTMSKVGRQGVDENQEIPEDMKKFSDVVKADAAAKKSYWGEATGLDDCLYFTLPSGEIYAPRLGGKSGACASLAAGSAKKYYDRGVMNIASAAGNSAMKGQSATANATSTLNNAIVAPLEPALEAAGNSLNSSNSASSVINMPDSSSGSVLGGSPAGMPASGASLNAPSPASGDPEVQLATALAQQAVNFQNLSNLGGNVASSVSNMLGQGFSMAQEAAGDPLNNVNGLLKFLLNALGLGDLIDVINMRTSRGTETLFQKPGLGGVVAADMGLPAERFGFWEMRNANIGNYKIGDRAASNLFVASPEIQDNALKDLGPSFVVGLQEAVGAMKSSLKEEGKFSLGRAPIKDYDADIKQDYLQAMGKARVYYRAPVERWTSRMQVISHANLMLPYWNARLEGLNYPEKLLFFTIN